MDNSEEQKFCGSCGKSLTSEQVEIPEEKTVPVEQPKISEKKG